MHGDGHITAVVSFPITLDSVRPTMRNIQQAQIACHYTKHLTSVLCGY